MAEIAGIVIGAVGLAALESSVCSAGLLQLLVHISQISR
jgi:hypothetical protein